MYFLLACRGGLFLVSNPVTYTTYFFEFLKLYVLRKSIFLDFIFEIPNLKWKFIIMLLDIALRLAEIVFERETMFVLDHVC